MRHQYSPPNCQSYSVRPHTIPLVKSCTFAQHAYDPCCVMQRQWGRPEAGGQHAHQHRPEDRQPSSPPAPTPTPTPQANFLNLPNIGNLQNLLGALPGNQVCVQSGNGVHGRCLNRSILALACIASWAAHATMAQLGLNDQRLLSLSFGCLKRSLCSCVWHYKFW